MNRFSDILHFSVQFGGVIAVVSIFALFLYANTGNRKTGFFILSVVATLISAVRCNVGSDFIAYFNQANSIDLYYSSIGQVMRSRYQSGIVTLSFFLKKTFDSPFILFYCVSIFVGFAIYFVYRQYSQWPTFSLIIWLMMGLYLQSMNILKQTVAMELLLLGYFALKQNHKKLAVVLSFIATWFHVSSLIAIVIAIFAINLRVTRKVVYLSIFLAAFGAVLIPYLLVLVVKIPVFSTYSSYVNGLMLSGSSNAVLRISVLFPVFISILTEFLLLSLKEGDKYREDYIGLILAGLVISILSIRFYFSVRVAYYFLQFVPLAMAEWAWQGSTELTNLAKLKKRFGRALLIVLLMCAYVVANTAVASDNEYYGYSTVFNDVPMTVDQYTYDR